MRRYAYTAPDSLRPTGFDLTAAAQPSYMGLTATLSGQPALITGWDGRNYILEDDQGNRYATSDIQVSSDDIVDGQTMEHNARVAALRSKEAPFSKEAAEVDGCPVLVGLLEFDAHTGRWDLPLYASRLVDLSDVVDRFENYEVKEAAPKQHHEDLMRQMLEMYQQLSPHRDTLPPHEQAAVDAFPVIAQACMNPEIDHSNHPAIQRLYELYGGPSNARA